MPDHPVVDLRSDTVTKPTAAMREAMLAAEIGDDVYGEDPTVNALEAEVARLLGQPAAVFVASGTMANQIALKAHTQPGDEVVVHPLAHILRAESAGGAAISGVQFRTVGDAIGNITPDEIDSVFQDGANPHFAPTRLLCLENTHNMAGGTVLPTPGLRAATDHARARGLACHLDGARMLNACIAEDVQPATMAAGFDSVSICFSKGLGAPVGSAIVGSPAFIARCRRYRKMFGGGMRQAGFLAAAARHALKEHVQRLAEDHRRARALAEALGQLPHVALPYGAPQTNMVFFTCCHPRLSVAEILAALRERGVLLGTMGPTLVRAVTHLDVDDGGIEQAATALRRVLSA